MNKKIYKASTNQLTYQLLSKYNFDPLTSAYCIIADNQYTLLFSMLFPRQWKNRSKIIIVES